MLPYDPTAAQSATTNSGFITRWNRIKQSKEETLYGRLHCDICNVPQYLIPGVRLRNKIKETQFSFLPNEQNCRFRLVLNSSMQNYL
jgi:hypothetical protein